MENNTEKIGALLKEKRQELGHTLQDAAQHTRIRKTYLESIECDRLKDLPGRAYVTGFIRVYARYLELDSDQLLAQLEESCQDDDDLPQPATVTLKQPVSSTSFTAGSGWKAFAIGFLLVLVVGAVVYQYLKPAILPTEDTERGPVVAAPAKEPLAPVVETAAAVVDKTTPPEVVAQQETDPINASIEVEPAEHKVLSLVLPEGSSLRMLALAESSLIIYLDERKPHQYNLHDGLDLTWKIKGQAIIEMAGTNVARFWLDGKELDLDEVDSFQLQQTASE